MIYFYQTKLLFELQQTAGISKVFRFQRNTLEANFKERIYPPPPPLFLSRVFLKDDLADFSEIFSGFEVVDNKIPLAFLVHFL